MSNDFSEHYDPANSVRKNIHSIANALDHLPPDEAHLIAYALEKLAYYLEDQDRLDEKTKAAIAILATLRWLKKDHDPSKRDALSDSLSHCGGASIPPGILGRSIALKAFDSIPRRVRDRLIELLSSKKKSAP